MNIGNIGGPEEAIEAMDLQAVQDYFIGESGDPAQVVERLEERIRNGEE